MLDLIEDGLTGSRRGDGLCFRLGDEFLGVVTAGTWQFDLFLLNFVDEGGLLEFGCELFGLDAVLGCFEDALFFDLEVVDVFVVDVITLHPWAVEVVDHHVDLSNGITH